MRTFADCYKRNITNKLNQRTMRKRLFMTTVALLLSMLWSISLWAEIKEGTFDGTNISWTYDTESGTVTINGTGEIPELDGAEGRPQSPWYLDWNVKKAVVGEGITRIGNQTFSGCLNLTEVSFPSTLKEIGDNAFSLCNFTNGITFPESLQKIGESAFWSSKLTSITLPSNVKSLASNAFANTKIKSVTIPKSVTEFVNGVFYGSPIEELKVEEGNTVYTSRDRSGKECNAVISISDNTLRQGCKSTIIPDFVTTIGQYAFAKSPYMKEMTIPDNVTKIEYRAFYYCTYLKKITIGSGITEIGEEAFNSCEELAEIDIKALTPPTCGKDCFEGLPANYTFGCVKGAEDTYKKEWAKFNHEILRIDPRVYAEYDTTTKYLKFYYDKKTNYTEGAYVIDNMSTDQNPRFMESVNTYMKEKTGTEDSNYSYITSVDFDESFKNYKPTTCKNMFYHLRSMKTISHLEYLNTENVTDMTEMFMGCWALKHLDLSTFNTEKVTCTRLMFSFCTNIEALDLTAFNTSNITDMYSMFENCESLKSLDISSFDTHNVIDMQNMFAFNIQFKGDTKIYVGDNFVTYQLPEGKDDRMFSYQVDMNKRYANYTNEDGIFLKKVGTLGGKPLGAKGTDLVIDKLTIADGSKLVLTETAPVSATAATYSRTMTSKWGTLCLPYDINPADESNNCKYYTVDNVTTDAITLKQLDGTITAGTPVLFCRNSETDNATIPGNGTLNATAGTSKYLEGTFDEKILADNDYFIAKDAFRRAGDYKGIDGSKGVKVTAYRAYIKNVPTANANVLNIFVGDPTSIDGINGNATTATAEYYDLTGKRLDALQKGVNIVKMGGKTKKVIVK